MVNRNLYDEEIMKMREICSHHSGCNFEDALRQLMGIRDNFDIKIMVVGHFSAGKSALLNELIGEDELLKEAQSPQTAIATELKYAETESMIAYDNDGNKEDFNLQKEYAADKYNHLEFKLNNSALKEICDFTIVDTPGFDAGIEAHAKALANYIGAGSAYLVVIDQEKGGIDQTTLGFINEISNYSSQIAILINKCDKITPELAEEIAESARFTLATNGLPYEVYTLSRFDDDISEKLKNIILSFDPQAAFNKVLLKQIKTELINIEKILMITKNKIYLDTYELDSAISKYTRMNEQLTGAFARKREEATKDIDNIVQEIIKQIRSSLESHSGPVAEALISGNQVAAEAIVVETVRPIMLSTMKNIGIKQIDSIVDALNFTGMNDTSDSTPLFDVALNIAENLKGFIGNGRMFEIDGIPYIEKTKKNNDIYHAITGIAAIATNVVAPWLEIIIILAPEIKNFLQYLFGESELEKVEHRYINNIIPQIMNKIYPLVRENTENTTKLVIDEYENMMKEKIESIKTNLTEAKDKKDKKVEEFEQYKTTLSEDIEVVHSIIDELRG